MDPRSWTTASCRRPRAVGVEGPRTAQIAPGQPLPKRAPGSAATWIPPRRAPVHTLALALSASRGTMAAPLPPAGRPQKPPQPASARDNRKPAHLTRPLPAPLPLRPAGSNSRPAPPSWTFPQVLARSRPAPGAGTEHAQKVRYSVPCFLRAKLEYR